MCPGSGGSFLIAPAEGMSSWAASFVRGLGGAMTGVIALDAGIVVALTFVLSAPIVIVAATWVWRRRPLVMPALVLCAAAVAAAVITVVTGLFGDPVALAAAAPVLAAIVIIRVPDVRARLDTVLPLLVMGWLGGAATLAIIDPRIVTQVDAMLARVGANPARADDFDLGGVIADREGVLVDSVNAPAVVVGRRRATGLITPQHQEFGLAILTSTIDAPFVAVSDPQSATGAQDRLNKAFPQLYQRGPPGYRLVYHNATWRLFKR